MALKREDGVCLNAEKTSVYNGTERGEKKTTLWMKRDPEEGFQRKQKDLSNFPFSTSVKSDSESPIRAVGLKNKFNEKHNNSP